MTWVALNCPQCSAPLPRVALWRAVKCGSCGSLITKTESVVLRDSFRQALNRARCNMAGMDGVVCGGLGYRLVQELGVGEVSKVYLACRVGPLPLLATLKISSAPAAAGRFEREARVLRELQNLDGSGAGLYFLRLLPEVVSQGVVEEEAGRRFLLLRHPTGCWGSLGALNERFAGGIDPRHAVWIWRRILEVLNFIHKHGWCHGDVRPEHALVHPRDHGVRLIGWESARSGAGAGDRAADLCRSARVVRVLLAGAGGPDLPDGVPSGLAGLVTRAAMAEDFCRPHGAEGLDALLREEARAAFGPPAFVPLTI